MHPVNIFTHRGFKTALGHSNWNNSEFLRPNQIVPQENTQVYLLIL